MLKILFAFELEFEFEGCMKGFDIMFVFEFAVVLFFFGGTLGFLPRVMAPFVFLTLSKNA